jgi:hypothetical protein
MPERDFIYTVFLGYFSSSNSLELSDPLIKSDIAVADALLIVRNVNGADGKIIPVIPINFFFVGVRHGDRWRIKDGRTHFAAALPSSMTARK